MKLGNIQIPASLVDPGQWIFQLAISPDFWESSGAYPTQPRPTEPPFVGMYPTNEFYVINLTDGTKTAIKPGHNPEFNSTDSVEVYQRSYGITYPGTLSGKQRLFTTNLAPCVSLIIWQPHTQIAALSHWDAEQDYFTLSMMLDEYHTTADHELDIYFHGGRDADKSADTTKRLLHAIYAHPLSDIINVRGIDITVLDNGKRVRNCTNSIGIDTRSCLLSPSAYTPKRDLSYDSKVRWVNRPVPCGSYALGSDGVDMKKYWDAIGVHADIPIDAAEIVQIQREAAKIRKQFDGRDENWIQEVSDLIFTYPIYRSLFIRPTPGLPANDFIDFLRNKVNNEALFVERSLQSDQQRDNDGEPILVDYLVRVLELVQVGPDGRLIVTAEANEKFDKWIIYEKQRQSMM